MPDDWGLVVENYTSLYRSQDYVTQMKRLNRFIKENPDAPYARFLRGYHYGYLKHKKAARTDLVKAFELESRDELASELLVMMGGDRPAHPAAGHVQTAGDGSSVGKELNSEQRAQP